MAKGKAENRIKLASIWVRFFLIPTRSASRGVGYSVLLRKKWIFFQAILKSEFISRVETVLRYAMLLAYFKLRHTKLSAI